MNDDTFDNHHADDDYVRPPDAPVRERLISYNTSISDIIEYPNEADIIQQSWREYEDQQNEMEMTFLANESLERKEAFLKTKPQLERLMKMDREKSSLYADLLTKITLYEEGWMTHAHVSPDNYIELYQMIQTIRIPQDERSRLATFIAMEE